MEPEKMLPEIVDSEFHRLDDARVMSMSYPFPLRSFKNTTLLVPEYVV
jgi:hypothetical protein